MNDDLEDWYVYTKKEFFGWSARVAGQGLWTYVEGGHKFYSRTKDGALARAQRWIDDHERITREYNQDENILRANK